MRPLILLALLAMPAVADEAQPWTVDAKASHLAFHIHHKLHEVTGRSQQTQGVARLLPDGRVQVEVRVPATSFVTGNVQRDSAMREAVEAARYPDVVLKATLPSLEVPTHFPTTSTPTFSGQLTFHGVSKQLQIPVTLTFAAPGVIDSRAKFSVSLTDYSVKRPALMFVKVDDKLDVEAEIAFRNPALGPGRAAR
jgi:polyisoprenoid-binding protein YceI